ncbi:MAG: 4Fe-4S binding protein [Myxococcaceae bacterium]
MLPEATWVRPPGGARLHRSRRALQLATSLLLVVAPFLDLLRFDLKGEALVLGRISFGLRELGVVYLILLLAIVAVFAGALLYGRIYCGWMCPQTTLSELVATLERRGVPSHAAAVLLAAFVAASLVSYFVDPADRLAPGPVAWVAFAASFAVIAADLLWVRHRFCVGLCPYGILQNVVQDARTLGVSLDPSRRAECRDCTLCVRACFMGVDIRSQPFDPRCLNCGDCIAASRLARRCPPDPLIRFRYGSGGSRWPAFLRRLGILDGRRAVVMALVAVGLGLLGVLLAGRRDLDLGIAAQFDRIADDRAGVVHNHYRLTVGNRLGHPVRLRLEARGVPGIAVEPSQADLSLAAGERGLRDLVLSAPATSLGSGVHPITVLGIAESGEVMATLSARFFVPDRR